MLDFLTLQLDRDLISHNVMVSDLKERVCKVFLKLYDMLEEIKKLRNEKHDLKVRFPGHLEELKKALDDNSELQEKVTSNQLEIATLREVIDREYAEKLDIRLQVRLLKSDLESQEADVKELRADSKCQIDRYNKLWMAYDNLLMETHALKS